MDDKPITVDEFKERLIDLCVQSALTNLPHRFRDRHILMKSMILDLNKDQKYTEKQIDEKLKLWLATTGCSFALDHVTLRRQLIEYGYMGRERDGSRYWVCNTGFIQTLFEPAVENVNVAKVIHVGRECIRQKKQEYLHRKGKL